MCAVLLIREAIPSWILDPGVITGALQAGEQTQSLARKFPGSQGTRVGQRTEGLAFHHTFVLPVREVSQGRSSSRGLHPLDYLWFSDEVNVRISQKDVVHPLLEDIIEALVTDQPGGIERERQGSLVGPIMTLEVVLQQLLELILVVNVGTRRHQVTTSQIFIEVGVITTIQLIDGHFPDGMRPGRTVATVAMALVWYPVVGSVGPDRDGSQWGGDRRVVSEELVSHHDELLVATNTQVGSSHANYSPVGDVGKPLDYQPRSSHFSQPCVVISFCPVFWILSIGNREHSNLVTLSVKFLDSRVVSVFMRDEESSLRSAAIGIDPFIMEQFVVDTQIFFIDGTVEGHGYHHGNVIKLQFATSDARSNSTINRTVTVRQLTSTQVTHISSVGIFIHRTCVLVTSVLTVGVVVAEQFLQYTFSVTTLQLPLRTDRFSSVQVWFDLPRFRQPVAVVHARFPVTSLSL